MSTSSTLTFGNKCMRSQRPSLRPQALWEKLLTVKTNEKAPRISNLGKTPKLQRGGPRTPGTACHTGASGVHGKFKSALRFPSSPPTPGRRFYDPFPFGKGTSRGITSQQAKGDGAAAWFRKQAGLHVLRLFERVPVTALRLQLGGGLRVGRACCRAAQEAALGGVGDRNRRPTAFLV